MNTFIARFGSLVTGVLAGFDRMVFRGHLLPLMRDHGMFGFLTRASVRLLDFKDFAVSTTERVKAAALAEALAHNRPVDYLASSSISKEDRARELLAADPIEHGIICAFKALEPCMTFEYHRSKDPAQRGPSFGPASASTSTSTGSIRSSGS